MHRADDQGRGGGDVGARVVPAEALLALQVGRQQGGQPLGFPMIGAAAPVTIPPGLSARLAGVVLEGIAPGARRQPS